MKGYFKNGQLDINKPTGVWDENGEPMDLKLNLPSMGEILLGTQKTQL